LADPGDLERHRDAREPRRIARRTDALNGDVESPHGNSRLAGVSLDQRDAARGNAGQKCLAVGEGVWLRSRRRVERQTLASHVTLGAADDSHARRPDRVDFVGVHVCRAPFTRSGVNGTRRRRTPVAAKTALAMTAGTGQAAGSPAPTGGWSRRSISTISMASGTSLKRRSG